MGLRAYGGLRCRFSGLGLAKEKSLTGGEGGPNLREAVSSQVPKNRTKAVYPKRGISPWPTDKLTLRDNYYVISTCTNLAKSIIPVKGYFLT